LTQFTARTGGGIGFPGLMVPGNNRPDRQTWQSRMSTCYDFAIGLLTQAPGSPETGPEVTP